MQHQGAVRSKSAATAAAPSIVSATTRAASAVAASLTQVMYVSRTYLKPPCFYAAHMLLQIDLSGNQIGGYSNGVQMVSTPEGPKAIADAICVSTSLTSIDLHHNFMRDEGEALLRKAVEGRSGFKLLL